MNEEKARKIIEYNTQDYYIDISWEECDEFKEAIFTFIKLYEEEKEKNKKLEETINNLAKAVKFMGTNDELTADEIIKMFSPEEIKMNFDDFMKRWENEQHKKADLKDKVIDMMEVDYMNNHISGEYSDTPCEYYEEIEKKEKCKGKMWDDVCFEDCKECLKQYYFKKARGEEL